MIFHCSSFWTGMVAVFMAAWSCVHTCAAEVNAAPAIAESEIVSLHEDFAAAIGKSSSAIARRRDLKNIVRTGQALLDKAPDASNRYRLLGLMFHSQKRLLAMENSERNRTTLFDISGRLAEAPDEYAEVRVEADLMLSERQLSENNATLAERAEALKTLLERYHETSGEAKSLLMAALIVQKLDAPELEDSIYYALDERFSDDHEVIEFRRKHLRISRLDVTFSGRFRRVDGAALVFPIDTMGHVSLMVFWSKDKPGTDAYLDRTKEELAKFPGRVDVFSFNVDDLADGGASLLRAKGLDWTVIKIPGGRQHQAYRTYAQGDPVALLVNEYGLSVTRPEIVHGRTSALDPARISEARYMTQLQSLFIGDFLITASDSGLQAPPSTSQMANVASELKAVRASFPLPPFRYRLTLEQAVANYLRAEKLSTEAMNKNPGAAGVRLLRDRRMIARLGIWNLDFDPHSLDRAVEDAHAVLASAGPPEGEVVARFCLAKAAIRADESKAESAVADFLTTFGGKKATASALAAATILALDAKSRELHEEYRSAFLDKYADNPGFYEVTAFLRDRHHRYRLLRPNYARRERGTRGYIVAHGYETPVERLPDIELETLDGSPLILPRGKNDKLTLLLFVEPPDKPDADFPVVLDRNGNPTRSDHIRQVVGDALRLAENHINHGVEVIVAFLCDDADRVASLMQANEWTCEAAVVPDGVKNPLVRQLGIYSADRLPNVFLLERDGTIAWRASGYTYQAEFGFPFAFLLAMKVHIERCEVNHAYDALERGEFEQAARAFGGPYLPWHPDRFAWRSPRYHGQTLAYMGLQKWDLALEAIDKSIDAHKLKYFHGRRSKNILDWRKDAATVTVKQADDILTELWATKAVILNKLGRSEEAAALQELAAQPAREEYPHIYKLFHEKLKQLRQNSPATMR